MIVNWSPETVHRCPPDLLRLLTYEGELETEDAFSMLCVGGKLGDFLDKVGMAAPPGGFRPIPRGVLLDFGAVGRLLRWETAGLTVHRDAGLPSAAEALGYVYRALIAAAAGRGTLDGAGALARAVFDVLVTRIAWAGRPDLGADIVLDAGDDDDFAEALAQLLWARRADVPPAPQEISA